MIGFLKKIPWGTILFLVLVIGGLYTLYPSGVVEEKTLDTVNGVVEGKTPSTLLALLYALGIIAGLILVFCWFLFRPQKKDKKKEDDGSKKGGETKKGDEVKKDEAKKTVVKETRPLLVFIIAVILGVLAYFVYEYQLAHFSELISEQKVSCRDKSFPRVEIQVKVLEAAGKCTDETVPQVVKPGHFYIPVSGLLIAYLLVAITALLDTFRLTGFLTGMAFYIGFLPVGIYFHWFMPHVSDILVPWWAVLLGVAVSFIPILFMRPTDWFLQQNLMGYIPITAAAVFLPQLCL